MHPELLRAMAAQQAADWQAEARAGLRARVARRERRARRARQHHAADPLAGVRVPDYVDGTFRDGPENTPAGRAEAVK